MRQNTHWLVSNSLFSPTDVFFYQLKTLFCIHRTDKLLRLVVGNGNCIRDLTSTVHHTSQTDKIESTRRRNGASSDSKCSMKMISLLDYMSRNKSDSTVWCLFKELASVFNSSLSQSNQGIYTCTSFKIVLHSRILRIMQSRQC